MKRYIISLLPLLSFITVEAPVPYPTYVSDCTPEQNDQEAYVIMFDLGGTLVDVNHISFARKLGILDAAMYLIFDVHLDTKRMQARIFETLEALGGPQEGAEQFKCKHNGVCNLPKIMALWLAGIYDEDSDAFIEELEKGIDQLYATNFFISKREYRLIRKAVRAMFSPETLAYYQELIKPMYRLLERIDHTKHTCMILSNWDAVSFEIFINSPVGQKLTTYVDKKNIVISGAIGLNKPHPAFFDYVLYTYNLNAARCILIDNDAANCATARTCGIAAIHADGDIKKIEQEFENRNILKRK